MQLMRQPTGKEGGGCPFIHPLMPLGCLARLPSLRVGQQTFYGGPNSKPRGFEGPFSVLPL